MTIQGSVPSACSVPLIVITAHAKNLAFLSECANLIWSTSAKLLGGALGEVLDEELGGASTKVS